MNSVADPDHTMDGIGIAFTTELHDPDMESGHAINSLTTRDVLHEDDGAISTSATSNGEAYQGTKTGALKAAKYAPLPYASSRTGLVYDVRMRFHTEPLPRHQDMHPEDPRRIYAVYHELLQAGLVDDPGNAELAGDYVLLRIPARSATRDEVLACHSVVSYDFVMSLKGESGPEPSARRSLTSPQTGTKRHWPSTARPWTLSTCR